MSNRSKNSKHILKLGAFSNIGEQCTSEDASNYHEKENYVIKGNDLVQDKPSLTNTVKQYTCLVQVLKMRPPLPHMM